MTKHLVIDSQLAANDLDRVFNAGWRWPIAQSEYNDPIAKFFAWSDELHKDLTDLPQLLTAFLLIKSDLLKDISYYISAWLDMDGAKRAGYEIVFESDQYIHQSIISGYYGQNIPSEILRRPLSNGFRGALRNRLTSVKRNITNKISLRSSNNNVYMFQPNHLSNEIVSIGAPLLRLLARDVDRRRGEMHAGIARIDELATHIAGRLSEILSSRDSQPPPAFVNHIRTIASHYLRIGWHDAGAAPLLRFPALNRTLVTGTGGGYLARLISYQSMAEGHRVIRTTHGGESPLFELGVLWPSTEFPFTTHYVANGAVGAKSLKTTIDDRSESIAENYPRSVIGAGSALHSRIRDVASESPVGPVKTVSVITASLTRMFRVVPAMKLHDVVYIEWHRRLLGSIKRMGYEVLSKRHPKAFLADQRIFSDIADEELIQTPMRAIEKRTDAYVIDFLASAFMEAICTLKPVIFIDMGIRKMKPEARSAISESVVIISSSFDDRNRVIIDEDELRLGLEKPVDIAARDRLIQDYLLRPSEDFGSLFE